GWPRTAPFSQVARFSGRWGAHTPVGGGLRLHADAELHRPVVVDLGVEHLVVERDRGVLLEEDPGAAGLEHRVAGVRRAGGEHVQRRRVRRVLGDAQAYLRRLLGRVDQGLDGGGRIWREGEHGYLPADRGGRIAPVRPTVPAGPDSIKPAVDSGASWLLLPVPAAGRDGAARVGVRTAPGPASPPSR